MQNSSTLHIRNNHNHSNQINCSNRSKGNKLSRKRGRHVIVNKARFFTSMVSLTAIVILLLLSISSVTGMLFSDAMEVEHYTVYVVKNGDTLWDIAKRYKAPEQDVRAMVHDITEANAIHNAVIHPGQNLNIPSEVPTNGIQSYR